jgi:hypothetical protein
MNDELEMCWKPIFLIGISILVFFACESSEPEDQIPFALVNETINLTNQQYLNLQFNGGHVNIDGGVRGIIIYRVSETEYRAFERNCSFEPLNTCARVEVDGSNLFMIDACCSSSFDFNGFPTGGPANLPLRQYQTLLQGNFLTITN